MALKDKLSKKQIRKMYGVLEKLPSEIVINLQYFATVGRFLNLKNPVRFTEKINWYKLNYQVPLMTMCADKYRVREYIQSKNYSEYMPELYGVYDNFEEINFEELPNSFAIKCNNGAGTNIFVKNKDELDLEQTKIIVDSWSKVNTISVGREWAYKNIEQKITIEELLVPDDNFQIGYGLNDYKILCFNGKAEYIWVDVSRQNQHQRNFYDLEWNKLDIVSDHPNFEGTIEKPDNLNKMIEIAEDISKDFPFVRVDFYYLKNRIYMGELTFYPWSGCVQFTPDEFDYELGSLFNLPNKIREK